MAILSDTLFLDAAAEIGDTLAALAITKKRQVYWKIFDKATETVVYDRNDLYSGCAGIGLFFLELYKHTHNKRYLRLAKGAVRTAAQKERMTHKRSSFIVGHMGVAYALMKVYEVTKIPLYRSRALALAKTCRNAYSPIHEYINGNAGAVLALLHMHAICRESWLLEMANDYMSRILQAIHKDSIGVYWDRATRQVRPLCGFSHGTSGIGFVLLEVGRYLQNPAFYGLAEQTFAYENAYFDAGHRNWPDFRLDMWTPEALSAMEKAYLEGNLEGFSKTAYMSTWCHGAPGIGLARILAYQLTGKQTYLRDINRALHVAKHADPQDTSICHGLAGNLEIFIENYLAYGRPEDWKDAETFGKRLLHHWGKTRLSLQSDKTSAKQINASLFTGLAGAGYALLRLHDPRLTPSILAPRIPTPLFGKFSDNLSTLHASAADIQALMAKEAATDSAAVKKLKCAMIEQYPSNGLLFIKHRVNQKAAQRLRQLTDNQLLDRTLQLDTSCVLHMESPSEGVMLRYSVQGIKQKSISLFCYVVLAAFQKPRKVGDALNAIAKYFNVTQPEQHTALQTKALEQIRHALLATVLLADRDAL